MKTLYIIWLSVITAFLIAFSITVSIHIIKIEESIEQLQESEQVIEALIEEAYRIQNLTNQHHEAFGKVVEQLNNMQSFQQSVTQWAEDMNENIEILDQRTR